jgi:thiamine pyrophosphokinase
VRVCARCNEHTKQIQRNRSTKYYRLRLVDGESIRGNEWELQHDRVSTGVYVLLANRAIDHIDIWEKRASLVCFLFCYVLRT